MQCATTYLGCVVCSNGASSRLCSVRGVVYCASQPHMSPRYRLQNLSTLLYSHRIPPRWAQLLSRHRQQAQKCRTCAGDHLNRLDSRERMLRIYALGFLQQRVSS